MIIGTRRVEEAKVFDSEAGFHRFHSESGEPFGSFEIFLIEKDEYFSPGWYWWACQPGCLPDARSVHQLWLG